MGGRPAMPRPGRPARFVFPKTGTPGSNQSALRQLIRKWYLDDLATKITSGWTFSIKY